MKSLMDIDAVNNCVDKFKIYQKEEQLLFEDLYNNFSKIENNYQSNQSDKINNLKLEIVKKFEIISKIHSNNVFVLEKNIEKYKNTELEAQQMLDI